MGTGGLLRNTLVHHFIDQHDLWTLDGCAAQDELGSAYTRIDQHFEQLRGWAEHMDQARRLAAEFVQSDVFHDLVVNGITPDGTRWTGRPPARCAVGRRGLDTHRRRWPLGRGPASRAASSQVRLQQLAAGGARVPPVRASLP